MDILTSGEAEEEDVISKRVHKDKLCKFSLVTEIVTKIVITCSTDEAEAVMISVALLIIFVVKIRPITL